MKKYLKITNAVLATMMGMSLISGCGNNNTEDNKQVISDNAVKTENILKVGQDENGEESNYYTYNATEDGHSSVRSDVLTPDYYIFAGNKGEEEANELLKSLGMLDEVQEWGSRIYIINPMNGEKYEDKDKEAFIDLAGSAIRNVKVIGIDEGATFVNNYISQSCYFVAGIMTYGGEMNEGLEKNDIVPIYLSDASEEAEEFYKNINEVTKEDKQEEYTIYKNEENSLQAVAIANEDETLESAFDNAWESIFSKNYRQHNDIAEFYNLSARDVTSDYELIQTPIFEDLNVTYNQMIDAKVSGMDGAYTWFEYVPNSISGKSENSTALVVTLHGNQNDPRLQGDSTGWIELASKEEVIVVSPEWQEKDVNFFKCDGLGGDGVMNLIKDLQEKYPQIDPSRIYLTGLSIGGAESFLLGLQYSDVFAAVASVSGVNVFADEVTEIANNYSRGELPLLYLCGDHDFFQMIPVDGSSKYGTAYLYGNQAWDEDENTHIFSSLQAYQKINGLEVSEMDMSKNEYYGIALDNQGWSKLGDKEMYTGTLSNKNGVVMELAAIKDLAHFNYKPEAEYMWNFFDNYRRDVETGKLIFNDK